MGFPGDELCPDSGLCGETLWETPFQIVTVPILVGMIKVPTTITTACKYMIEIMLMLTGLRKL